MTSPLDITPPNDLAACQALIEKLACDYAAQAVAHDRQLRERDIQRQEQDQQLRERDIQRQQQDQQLRERDIQRQEHEQKYAKLSQDYDELQLAYNKLLQQRFGRRSERYLDNPDQLRIDFGDADEAADAALGLTTAVEELEQTVPAHTRRRPRKQRDESLPAHLPRYEVIAEVDDDLQNCPTHGPRTLLPEAMWDTTETLEFERPRMKVRVTKYPKYACDDQPQCGIASPARPAGLVEGDKYDSSIAAEIITGKYSYHLPLYRLQDYFAGSGWTPSRGTQCNILRQAHFVIEPLLEYFKTQVERDSIVGCDDTGVTLLYSKTLPELDLDDPRQRRMHEVFSKAIRDDKPSISANMWAYRGVTVPLNVFDFTVSRHRDGPEWFFADYAGTLLGDCWSGFEAIATASNGAIVRAACNAHARRKVFESSAYPNDAALILGWYQQLYDVEDRGQDLSADDRLALRTQEAKPIWEELAAWLDQAQLRTSQVILPKSDFGKALAYLRNHFVELQRYLCDGHLPIDNNLTEQLMKQVAVGRKNWLFAGSVSGGERTAGFFTLASSALRNDLDVWAYVKDVLDQLLSGLTDYESLLPWKWAESHPESIRQYRVEERRNRRAHKRTTRAARR
jgi:transposase